MSVTPLDAFSQYTNSRQLLPHSVEICVVRIPKAEDRERWQTTQHKKHTWYSYVIVMLNHTIVETADWHSLVRLSAITLTWSLRNENTSRICTSYSQRMHSIIHAAHWTHRHSTLTCQEHAQPISRSDSQSDNSPNTGCQMPNLGGGEQNAKHRVQTSWIPSIGTINYALHVPLMHCTSASRLVQIR